MPIYKTKIFKISIGVLILLFTAISIIVNLNSYSNDVLKKSQNAFNIVDTAYNEHRDFTNPEKVKILEFKEVRDKLMDKHRKGTASKKEEKDVVLLYAVGRVVDLYSPNMDDETLIKFNQRLKEAKILLD